MAINNLTIRTADWETEKQALRAIRRNVFILEQKVPEEMEWDDDDQSSVHFIVTLEGSAVATARLTSDGRIGRMSVLSSYRNLGIGSQLLSFILQTALNKNIKKLRLHAQVDAIRFYERKGFSAHGEIFYEANIPHREMSKVIC